ncbi:nuclear pore complex subunit Nup85 [Aspergillus ellipticus CBS 707.79]|uniref:Nuclear pore complex protein Nup85 n=1 Tax=Aspergillus ellipticus CBS 707.79 TaxID=1448320 RepID=A0A319CYJ7_9EURO|nr:nuclear pore complex subunit Nup85 [Aspergillus ellipticus CBS 707.79]
MSFKIPFESSPPSTPGKGRSLFDNLSSTPAGAPPSASNSFTPQGHPQSSVFGDSQMSSGSLFTKSGNFNANDSIFGSSIASNDFAFPKAKKTDPPAKSFAPSQSLFSITNGSRFAESTSFGQSNGLGESQMEEDAEQDAEGEEEAPMEEDEETGDAMNLEKPTTDAGHRFSFLDSQFGDSIPPPPVSLGPRKSIYSNPVNAKRPKLDERWANQSPLRKGKLSPKKDSAMPSIVRNFAARSRVAAVQEPSEFIINTEDEICAMYDEVKKSEFNGVDLETTLSNACEKLVAVWQTPGAQSSETGIGPGENASNVAKAGFLASILVQLQHPPQLETKPNLFNALEFAARNLLLAAPRTNNPTPLPKLLLDWLNAFHYPPSDELRALKAVEPNPTASSSFWELINAAVLRGHLSEAADILRSADFNHARSALEDGLAQAGYRGTQLQNIQRCINKARQLLESCPSLQHGDWDVRGAEWGLYRKRVMAAVSDLEEFAEGNEQPAPEPPAAENRFQAINFGLKPTAAAPMFSFAQSSRMAESKVPWTIYQNLRSLYRILLGDTNAVMNNSQDWIEATIGMTVWWDGEDDEESSSKDLGASNFLFSRPLKAALSPTNAKYAYLRRLDLALSHATSTDPEDAGFRLNSLNSLEVGLASVFEGNVSGVVELLQTWSLCVASAVVEVASMGGWLEAGAGPKSMPGLSEDDLMVLSYGQDGGAPSRRVDKNDVISAYALSLSKRPMIESDTGSREGWEVAIEVLSRLDDREKMQKSVAELLDKLPLVTPEQVDKVVLLCSELDLSIEGQKIAERFGDDTVAKTQDYGLALLCYARAHNRRKVKSIVDLLISYSLVQSRAYPESTDMDEQLAALIRDPGQCLSAVSASDDEAARILQYYFSGYATLRRFYETRDEALGLQEGQRPRFKPLARRRAAAQALVAVIGSAADSIYGGLYDPERDSVVQVDGLLTLLGEALPFVDQPTPLLSVSQQFTILSAIEDLQTVTPRVYAQCEECFRSTLIQYQSSKRAHTSDSFVQPPSPRAMLKKSVSSLTASSTFSLIGNDMIESARTRSGSGSGSVGSSGVLVPRADSDGLVPEKRGWDWRAGLPEDMAGEDVLRLLRLGIAKGLSSGALGSI